MGNRWHPRKCKVCGVTVEQAGHISASGLCLPHALERERENLIQLKAHTGPWFSHWRRQIAASVGAVLVDE